MVHILYPRLRSAIQAKVRLQAKTIDTGPALEQPAAITAPPQVGLASSAVIASHPPDPSAPVVLGHEREKMEPSQRPLSAPPTRQPREAIPLLMAVYRERGFLGWYQGLTAQVVKAVLFQGRFDDNMMSTLFL